MQIEINEQGSEAFYKETVNAAAQYRYILKDHHYKLKDYFKQFRTLLITSLLVLAVNVGLIIAWGGDTIQTAASAVLLVAALMCGAYLFSLHKACKSMMAGRHRSVLTLDESGAELDVPDTQTVKIARKNLAVVRIFHESLCFVPQAGAGVVISVDRKLGAEIPDWIRENWPEAEII